MNQHCKHPNVNASVVVNRLEDSGRFCADVRIACASCGLPFRFLGLPAGLNLNGAAVSPDGTEARLAIVPASESVHCLDGRPAGFRVVSMNEGVSMPVRDECRN